ncbi:MAG TPA: DUF4421 family protein [Cyclobacteriaceae bacterium]|nr:DUF4421 family protein [Cyclobacteriaceae bacterium]HRJ81512.1 DUF4421 family protein [Cyclobacteriaceae bacterium]
MSRVKPICITCLSCLLLLPLFSLAQLDTIKFIREDGWIEGMDNYVGLKLSINNNIETFQVDAGNLFYDLYPNTKTIAKLDFNYRFLSFNLTFAPAFLPGNADDDMKGKTKSFGLSFGFNFRHWFHSLSYSKVKGYYLNNSEDFPAYVPGDPYLQVPELVVISFEGLTGYSFNPKFSVKSLTTQTERQLKSVGSFIPVLGYRYYIVNNKDEEATSTQRSDNFELILGAGYHYTYVLKETFYVSLGATPGIGYIITKLTTHYQQGGNDEIVTHSNNPVVRLTGRGALGYNGRAIFVGAIYSMTGTSFEQEGTTVINSDFHTSYQIFAGIRINAPKKLRDNLAAVENLRK